MRKKWYQPTPVAVGVLISVLIFLVFFIFYELAFGDCNDWNDCDCASYPQDCRGK